MLHFRVSGVAAAMAALMPLVFAGCATVPGVSADAPKASETAAIAAAAVTAAAQSGAASPPQAGTAPGAARPPTAPATAAAVAAAAAAAAVQSQKPFAEVIKDAKESPGFFRIYQKEEKVWMEIEPSQFDLMRERRFAPFFWTQFAGAANDNVYKNALVIFVAFHAASLTSLDTNALVNLAGAVFIAPFVLFSASAFVSGQVNIFRPFVNISDILAAGKMMKSLNPEHVIPGHGPPTTTKLFDDGEKYYALLAERVAAKVKEGKSLDDITKEFGAIIDGRVSITVEW